jgi:hypothetical protein
MDPAHKARGDALFAVNPVHKARGDHRGVTSLYRFFYGNIYFLAYLYLPLLDVSKEYSHVTMVSIRRDQPKIC